MNSGANRSFDRSRSKSLAFSNNTRLYLAIRSAISFRACVFSLIVTLVSLFHVVVAAAAEGSNSGGLVDIGGGRKMYLECRGSGSPTVVLISGEAGAATSWTMADPAKPAPTVFDEVAKFARVCAYDRPGTPVDLADGKTKPSRSDPVPQPTTTQDAVRDLHALLQAANERGPYVLVGHSSPDSNGNTPTFSRCRAPRRARF